MSRKVVTEWKNWRDIVASERVIDLRKYKSTALHTWTRERLGKRDDPGPMIMSSFARINGLHAHVSLDVTLTAQAIEAIGANTIHVDDDTINIEINVWVDGEALVVANHSKIIGGVWLAKIDASTMPAFRILYEVRSGDDGLEGVFYDRPTAESYADDLRGIGASDVTITPYADGTVEGTNA
jgi:hypothetical protein